MFLSWVKEYLQIPDNVSYKSARCGQHTDEKHWKIRFQISGVGYNPQCFPDVSFIIIRGLDFNFSVENSPINDLF